ncbi:hypothetical protein TSUD_77410 [Trifolium subterraneum]|uniref:Uncharacterized protein n=1 Tax=Trifolium subterraneum TaxID=3900 RepID=A0A2Z6MMN0_TRISU|nr:hypothetical protein TSUD_77410 [Trifolium subterraneum]
MVRNACPAAARRGRKSGYGNKVTCWRHTQDVLNGPANRRLRCGGTSLDLQRKR